MDTQSDEIMILKEKVKMFDLYNKNKDEDINELKKEITRLQNERNMFNNKLYNVCILNANLSNRLLASQQESNEDQPNTAASKSQEHIRELNERTQGMELENAKILEENKKLKKTLEEFTQSQVPSNKYLCNKRTSNELYQKDNIIKQLHEKNMTMMEENKKLKKTLEENKKLKQDITGLRMECAQLRVNSTEANNRLLAVSYENQSLFNRLENSKRIEETNARMVEENDKLKKSLHDLNKERMRLIAKIHNLDIKYTQISKTNESLNQQFDEKVKAMKELDKKNSDLLLKTRGLENHVRLLAEDNESLEKENDTYKMARKKQRIF
ncbi:hypothetical protein GUITHDRAFT_133298 [Guillardia theta CCMP2712]|uniref:Uncharacterized protein n=1 Tax=Guillardia theta (strain CCMP2712) TaxID=905079 RepID=L1JX34_GUITC|nr:hypothetical protein GUITHDRAFT_133298 [Guillardia theta CCMP2712]EKX52884.1 hypothetical protein GUITHDRAFT_133298 [Guillardia theta CCMP2712]|eukprot:XP_005839864.1 hypothetical protein GUITHDRAFT_133298 [Guillardia theta CCMP2712]